MINPKRTNDSPATRALDMDSSDFSAAVVEETKKPWQPYYGRPLSDLKARQLLSNVCNIYHLLVIARSQGKAKK